MRTSSKHALLTLPTLIGAMVWLASVGSAPRMVSASSATPRSPLPTFGLAVSDLSPALLPRGVAKLLRTGWTTAAPVALPATITVNTTADTIADDGFCSLREAIIAANDNMASGAKPNECAAGMMGLDNIVFALGAGIPSIAVTGSTLPTITEPVIINGNTGGSTRVELNGIGVGFNNGLTITAGSSTIRGLVINRFGRNGIEISASGGNTVVNCLIGTDATGTIGLGNDFVGIRIFDAPNNTIGGTMTAERNILSGNNFHGVSIAGSSATGNKIIGNYIGTDASGTQALGNRSWGVEVDSAPNNIIGGITTAERNIISNNFRGVVIYNLSATGNKVIGNYIGTDVTGTLNLGNHDEGVNVSSAPNTTIGGTTAVERNLISGNLFGVDINGPPAAGSKISGNYIGTDVTGTLSIGNGFYGVWINNVSNITVGGATSGERNVISGNTAGSYGHGVGIIGLSTTGNKVIGNYIGTNATGTAALGNSGDGVFINYASNNIVGGTTSAERNLISGNNGHGVEITGEGTTGNKVTGNYIGTDATGTADLGNGRNGVYIVFAKDNTIGGTVAGARNVISGNDGSGITIQEFRTTGNQVLGNFIGTDATGTAALGNHSLGVLLTVTKGNIIGGTQAGARNIISGNSGDGVFVLAGQGNTISGNFIGPDVTGKIALGNSNGVVIGNSSANTVVGNLISGNNFVGVAVAESNGGQISGNLIGTDVTGTANLANGEYGVWIRSIQLVVGGTTAGAGNIIAFNSLSGVSIVDYAREISILSNSIFANASLGIDLNSNGVTPNDPNDPDTGSNSFQNFPVLTCAVSANGQTTIQGSLNSLANTAFRIEFFANDACDPSGNGEGQTFLGFQNVTTVGNDAPINITLPVAVAAGKFITATATRLDAMGNPVETSEFSACRAVLAPTLIINNVSVAEGNAGTVNAVFTVTLSGALGSCLPVTVNVATADNTATTAGNDYTATAGTLVFNTPIASNSVTQTITVQVKGDTNAEANESFFVNLSGATNATISDSQGIGTILDDDFLRVQTGDPLVCLGPGGIVNVTATVTNPNATPAAFNFNATLPTQLLALPGTCTTNVAGTTCTAANAASGTLNPGQTVTINYQAQVADGTPLGTQLCINSTAIIGGVSDAVTACVTVNCPAVGPGSIFPATAEVSDQKAGSVLVYNLYSSSIATPHTQNTRIAITNTHPQLPITVHLFFVDGATCSIADSLVCLTPNQTASFLASDIDPGTTGYIVAVASDPVTGCPVNFNYLIGDAYVKLSSGHAANLAAEAFAALAGGLPACNASSVTTVLNFDNVSYNRAPRVLAASNIPSRADGNETLIVLNRLGGSLASGAATLGNLFGILYDDAENPLSFTFAASVCQFRSPVFGNSFPRTAPRFEQFIPAGRSGWAKFYSLSDVGLLGVQLNFNANAGTSAQAFNQGHNLHKLSLTTAASLTIPIFPPNC